jgi:chromate transporter
LNRPASLFDLFLAFTRLALQGFGGVLAVAQRELVERLDWMSKEEFVETLAIALALAAFLLIGVLRWPLITALALLGGAGMLVAYWKLK